MTGTQFYNYGTKKRNNTSIDLTYKRFAFIVASSDCVEKLYKTLGELGSDGTNDWLGEGQCVCVWHPSIFQIVGR